MDDTGTEAEHLEESDIRVEVVGKLRHCYRNDPLPDRDILRMKQQYQHNDKVKVGERICCANCFKGLIKTSYQQRFCETRCKDRYWNSVDPVRRERAIKFNS